jgi:hypothetical protein
MEDSREFESSSEIGGKSRIFTCTIGSAEKKTLAKFHVNNPDQLINLLLQLTLDE